MAKNKILYIEDTQFDQLAFIRFMDKLSDSYDYKIASSTKEAKQILSVESFDVIVCDYSLGDGDAFDILNLKLDIPVIVATGFGSEEIAVKAIQSGAIDYLIKDIDFNYLKILPVRIENILIKINQAKEIVLAKKIAEESTLLKEAFLANMSHEIRTPMNAIIGFADILADCNLNKEENEYVHLIKKAGENLLTIINDVLDMSKINAGMMTFTEAPFSIKEICNTLQLLMQNKAQEKKIGLFFNCDSNVPEQILGDSTRLNQILINLIGNAIKFTENGSVQARLEIVSETSEKIKLKFSVIDTGIGIPPTEIDFIFDRFRQVAAQNNRKYGGTGLGLSIVKQLVELQGGELSLVSEVNKGSSFSFTIEFNKLDHSLDIKPNKVEKFDLNAIRKLNILLVEDNQLNIHLVKSIFSRNKLLLEVAENGQECIDKLNNGHFDIILMDMEMPVLNGYEATIKIRTELKNDIPIIAMTAHTMTGEKEKCLALGMNDFISKPINSNQLFEKIFNLSVNV